MRIKFKFFYKILAHLMLIICMVIALFPLLWIIRESFATRMVALSIPPQWIFLPTLENYKAVISGDFSDYLLNSFIITGATVCITITMATLSGYGFARYKFPYKKNMFFFTLTTRMGPPIAFALPYYIMYIRLHLLDTYLGIILIYSVYNLAFCIWLIRGFFQDIPKELDEIAMIDGCSEIGAFIRISLPLAIPGIITTAILSFIFTWNEFFYAMILTRRDTQPYTVQLPNLIGFTRIKWEEMCASAVLALIPVIALALIGRKRLVRGITFGSIK